jgi:polygalacturonase
LHNLHIFTNGPETFVPNLADTNLIYYGPGFHEITKDDKYFYLNSNKHLHIAGGAVLKTTIWIEDAQNVTISGHGILDASLVTSDEWGRTTVEIEDSKNIYVKDIIIVKKTLKDNNFHLVRAENVHIDNVKIIASTNWSDGVHMLCSKGLYVNNVFFHTSDDCIAIYASRGSELGSTRDVFVTNSTFWNDRAHPMFIGAHGNPNGQDTIRNILFQNIQVIESYEHINRYQGILAINSGENNVIHKVRFDNITIEDFRNNQLFNFKVFLNTDYMKVPGKSVYDIEISNVTYTGSGELTSQISGYDATRTVDGIYFRNVILNGKRIKSASEGNINIGNYATNICFDTCAAREPITLTSLSFSDKNESKVVVYPNPFENVISFSIPIEATLYNLSGEILFQSKGVVENIQLQNLPKGMYVLQVNKNRFLKINKE